MKKIRGVLVALVALLIVVGVARAIVISDNATGEVIEVIEVKDGKQETVYKKEDPTPQPTPESTPTPQPTVEAPQAPKLENSPTQSVNEPVCEWVCR